MELNKLQLTEDGTVCVAHLYRLFANVTKSQKLMTFGMQYVLLLKRINYHRLP